MEKYEEIPKNWKILSGAKNGIKLILITIEGGFKKIGEARFAGKQKGEFESNVGDNQKNQGLR
ncbi:hypothetical protein ACSAZL_12875 [Methanosarcina sp. T3]|uniref:hypothetical protein n=1 Tax=Methanosarcina sp. T3 TaxID=3439062 RepID=UPI003F82A36E